MATWKATCWLGSSSGYQELEVHANTYHGAKEQLMNIYGAEQVINLREVNSHSGSSDSGDSLFWLGAIAILVAIYYLWPILLGGLIIWIGYSAWKAFR
jgi:hypothetical protein